MSHLTLRQRHAIVITGWTAVLAVAPLLPLLLTAEALVPLSLALPPTAAVATGTVLGRRWTWPGALLAAIGGAAVAAGELALLCGAGAFTPAEALYAVAFYGLPAIALLVELPFVLGVSIGGAGANV
ncbi:hypothetical protein [Kitasatospora viridis]|uniref:hypothetical protein n=1 Tax=Kitasatospora viridis TaxID=281105 RepID=UPI0011A7A167|nr:hypothetical protein [Kitasatospora viridis]